MSDMTPKPSRTDEELRQAIFDEQTKLITTTGGNLGYGRFRNETTDKIMALIQADRERLYGELVAGIGEHETEYANLDGDAGYWEKHGRNEWRKLLHQQLNKVFNREEADNG